MTIISLKQGLGRLIRSTNDRGVLAILDPRLRTKAYGRTFLRSLPQCRVTTEIADLPGIFQTEVRVLTTESTDYSEYAD